jgi:hypothetical protein
MRRSYRRSDTSVGSTRSAFDPASRYRPTSSSVPRQTEVDFAQTLDVVERARFDSAYVPVLAAARHAGRRVRRPDPQGGRAGAVRPAGRVAAADLARTVTRQVGGTFEVLVEGAGKRGPSTQARTRTNRIVHIPDPLEPGSFAHARILAIDTSAAAAMPGVVAVFTGADIPYNPLPMAWPAGGSAGLSLALAESLMRRSSRSTRCSSTGGWTSARPSPHRPNGRASRTT